MSTFFEHPWRPTAAAFFVNGTVFGIWATQIPLMKERLALTPGGLGLTLLCIGLGAVTAMTSSGWLIRRFGSRALVLASAVPFCILLPLVASAPSIPIEVVFVFLFGAAGGSMDVAMNAQGSEAERGTGRIMMSSFHGMWSLGGLAGAGPGGLLLGAVSGPVQAVIVSVLTVVLVLVAQSHAPALRPAKSSDTVRGAGGLMTRALLIGVLMALGFATEGVVLDWSPLYLNVSLGGSHDVAALGYAAFSGAMAAMRFLGDRIRSRFGAKVLVRGGAGLALLGIALGPLTGDPVLAIIGYAAAGVGLSNVIPAFFSAAGTLPRPEAAIATVSTFGYAGLLIAPPMLGYLANVTSIAAVFIVAAAMCGIIAVCSRLAQPETSEQAVAAVA